MVNGDNIAAYFPLPSHLYKHYFLDGATGSVWAVLQRRRSC